MTYRLQLACSAAATALFLTACDPVTPADPAPLTPPEETGAPSGPDMPATDPSSGPQVQPAEAGTEDQTSCTTITADGLCGVRFGMSAEEAKAAHERGLHDMGDSAVGEEQACYYLGPQRGNYDVGYMVVDGSVQRVDIRAPGVATAQGVEVGMPATAVEGLYQEIERQPNKYTDRDNLIIQLQGDAKLIMETDEAGNISTYRVGLPPAVDYVEGCS